MELPPDIEFHQDIRLLIYRPRGLIDEAAINKISQLLSKISKPQRRSLSIDSPIHRKLMKLSSTSNTLFTFLFIGASLHKGRAPVKSAILATDSTLVHYARLLALLTQGSSIKVQVFQDRKEAAQWLGVPARTAD